MIRRRQLAAALALSCVLCASGPAPAADEPPKPLLEQGKIIVDAKGVARVLIQPEFRAAAALRAQLVDLAIPKLTIHLVAPRVGVPRPNPRAKVPPPVLSRLLLVGPLEAIESALSYLRRLDRPTRSVRICMTIAEVWGTKYTERGGSFLLDRENAPDQRNTMFRAFRAGFEPTEYVRSQVMGVRPYEGGDLTFFKDDFLGDILDITIRRLHKTGKASYVARPNLLLNEGETGTLESLRELPQLLFSGRADAPVVTMRDEQVGLKLRVVPTRIGTDEAVLDLDVWFRIPENVEDTGAPIGTLLLKERRVKTTVRLRDDEPMLISGLRIARSDRQEMDPIPLLSPISSALKTEERTGRASEIWFVVRVEIREPVIAPDGPTHHAVFRAR